MGYIRVILGLYGEGIGVMSPSGLRVYGMLVARMRDIHVSTWYMKCLFYGLWATYECWRHSQCIRWVSKCGG